MSTVQDGPLKDLVSEPMAEAESGSSVPSLGQRVFRPRTLISFVIGIAILVFGVSRLGIDVGATVRVVRSANLLLVIAALLVYYTAFPVRALRWRRMLLNAGTGGVKLPGLGELSEIIYLSWFANCVVPAKLGDVYRAYLLRQRSGISFSRAGGTIVAERLTDLAVLLVAMGISGLLSFQGKLPPAILTVLELGSAAVLVAGCGLLAMRRLEGLIRRFVPQRFEQIYLHFQDGTLGAFGSYPQVLGLTMLAWCAEIGRLYLVTQAVGLNLSPNFFVNLLMVAFIGLGEALLTAPPGTPGGIGYVEAGIAFSLVLLGASQPVALSVALLDRAISFGSLVVGGFIVYLFSQRHA